MGHTMGRENYVYSKTKGHPVWNSSHYPAKREESGVESNIGTQYLKLLPLPSQGRQFAVVTSTDTLREEVTSLQREETLD